METVQKDSCEKLNEKTQAELVSLCQKLLEENEELTYKKELAETSYLIVSTSFFWRLTKPLRVTLDFLKRKLRRVKLFVSVWHGIKFLKRHGLRAFLRRLAKRHVTQSPAFAELLEEQRKEVFEKPVTFSVLVPLYKTNPKYLKEMIQSVIDQTYPHWELCLADGSGDDYNEVETVVKPYAEQDSRIKYRRLAVNGGISDNTNACAEFATGEYFAFLDHDDVLSPMALYVNAKQIALTGADILYSDEDHLNMKKEHVHPFYKPDWSPDLLYSQMYICHFTVMKASLFKDLGGLRKEYDGSQDYDLMLRATGKTNKIVHVPAILYSWRECETSTAANADSKPYAHEAGRKALDSFLKSKYGPEAHADDSPYTFVFDARFGTLHGNEPKVSVIIPMKDNCKMSDACIRSILEKTTYHNYELLILDNRSEKAETFRWFEEIVKVDSRVRVLKADMRFNWSMINNYGIVNSTGDVIILLNNDTVIQSPDWMERLAENALRPEVGAVGAQLLYEDNTIQHAGVVVGLCNYAEHIFKGMAPVHFGAPFVSPMVNRNVLAVTGACLAISRERLEQIGLLDESFEICGSDVELCIRAYEKGFVNRYDANVKITHLESKSRDTYIPPIDFVASKKVYKAYWENGDPFFNLNLDIASLVPRESGEVMNINHIKKIISHFPPAMALARSIKKSICPPVEIQIPEIQALIPRSAEGDGLRLNLLTPSVDVAHVFGGISTAVKMFEKIADRLGCDVRIISTDAAVNMQTSTLAKKYVLVKSEEDSDEKYQVLSYNDRATKTFPVKKNDVFFATGWWTAYTVADVIEWQAQTFACPVRPLLYMVQDYEPGFYPWSSRYMMADSTYRLSIPTYAIINSELLREFFESKNYCFAESWSFDPILNEKLAAFLPENREVQKQKQILVYGRPSVDRNAFALLVESLKKWAATEKDAKEWTVYSAGEEHEEIDLGNGCKLVSLGKLTLEQYAKTMLDTYAGISLMVSPHPSYPPLEMSTFGIKTVTNCYDIKDLKSFNANMVSVQNCSPKAIGETLCKVCEAYNGVGTIENQNDYANGKNPLDDVAAGVAKTLAENLAL